MHEWGRSIHKRDLFVFTFSENIRELTIKFFRLLKSSRKTISESNGGVDTVRKFGIDFDFDLTSDEVKKYLQVDRLDH